MKKENLTLLVYQLLMKNIPWQLETSFSVTDVLLCSGSLWRSLLLLSASFLCLLLISILLFLHSHPRLLLGSVIHLPQVLSGCHQQVGGVKLITGDKG